MEQIIIGMLIVIVIIAIIMGGSNLLNAMSDDSIEPPDIDETQELSIFDEDKGMNYPQGTYDLAEGSDEDE